MYSQNKTYPDRLLKIDEVIEILGIGESTFWQGIRTGVFPKPVKLGTRTARWPLSQIMGLVYKNTA
jgi:prophage regulatory protein